MLPRRSTSSGNSQRRSSILKPPKSRQPFQDLDFNASSTENSPDTTKKRRVSFAEKKHVKEFCDHKEQGTIWDSTYEEPDHTNSKSGEISNENDEGFETRIEYGENLDMMMKQAGYEVFHDDQDSRGPETIPAMHHNGADSSATKIFFNTSMEIEMTRAIGSNVIASKTILGDDGNLDTTEPIGGIEPTVLIDRPVAETDLRDMEKTTVFDSSDADMKFTQVITSQKTSQNEKLDETDPNIEDRTIIFDDFVMDLTPIKYQPESVLHRARNLATDSLRATVIIPDKENVGAGNKTVFFNDSSCDMTEAVNSVMRQLPEIQLLRQNIAKSQISQNSEDVVNPLKTGNQTICFNDVDCEMTEAIGTLKTRDKSDTGRIIPLSTEMEIVEPIVSQNISSASEHGEKSSEDRTNFLNHSGMEFTTAVTRAQTLEPRDVSDAGQIIPLSTEMEIVEPIVSEDISSASEHGEKSSEVRTNVLNESGMEFTTAITRTQTVEDEAEENLTMGQNETEIHDNCDVDVTLVVEEAPCLPSQEQDPTEQIASSASNQFDDEESPESERERRTSNPFMMDDKSSDLSVEENSAVPTIDSCATLDPESKSVEQNYLSTENETIKTKKRKSPEIMDVDNIESCNLSIRLNSEHDSAQSMVHDESCHAISDTPSNSLAPNSKRIKVTDSSSEDEGLSPGEPLSQDNIASKTMDISLQESEESPEKQSRIFENTETANNCVESEEEPESSEKGGEVPFSYSQADRNNSMMKCSEDATPVVEEFERIGDYLGGDEFSVLEDESILLPNSDSETETMELPHVFENREVPIVQNCDVASPSKPSKFLDHNDDCCFVMFCEKLEDRSKSENCIWEIRSIDTEKLAIDFISKSLVVVIHLEAAKELTTPRIIKDIRIVSLLGDSADEDITMIHNILLMRLDQDNLKKHHRTTQDVLPLLELISQRIKLLIDFMLEFERLKDLHLINRTGNRISFRLHSYKVQLVMKITINLEPFEEISPNDVTVECVLGTIREKDIKQLINSVKKDHKFLTNYIKDVKEYVAVVVEK